ncbi:MAG: hypothetical protein M0P33_03955 [Massilibacteroides sp.]|nr:hypothetical protein [Massilibacteroides sp.]
MNSSDAPEVTSWETVGNVPGIILESLLRTADGGYAYLGCTRSYTDDQGKLARDVVAGEVSKAGEVLWQMTLGDTPVYARSLIPSADGGYLVLGYNESYGKYRTDIATGSKTWLIMLSPKGEIQWRKDAIGGTDYGMGIEIIPARDGGYVFVGQSLDEDDYANSLASDDEKKEMLEGLPVSSIPNELFAEIAMSSYLDIWIVKLDPAGEVEWQKKYGGTDSEQACAIIPDGDGGYVVVGDARSTDGDVSGGHGSRDIWILNVDSDGDLKWQKAIGGSGLDRAAGAVRTPDGKYIVLGVTLSRDGDLSQRSGNGSSIVAKLLPSGDLSRIQTIGEKNPGLFHAMTSTRDGGCIIAERPYSGLGERLIRLDGTGQTLWQMTVENVSSIVDLQPVVGGIAVTGLDKPGNVCFFTLGDEEAGLLPGQADASAQASGPSAPLSLWPLIAALGISAIVLARRRSGR